MKLLRALQEREFERVGDTRTIRVDTRIIAASNRDLLELALAGQFREDLFYRLNVVPIFLPPLRERTEDVPALVTHFLNFYNEKNDRYVAHIDPRALEAMQRYAWPGNVRELQNYIERAVVMAHGDELTYELLPEAVRTGRQPKSLGPRTMSFDELTEELVVQGLNGSTRRGRGPARADRQPRGAGGDLASDAAVRQACRSRRRRGWGSTAIRCIRS